MRYILFILTALFALPHSSRSQDSLTFKANRSLTFYSGYSKHIIKDDMISPLIYSGAQLPIFIQYQSLTPRHVQSISVYFDYLKLTSSISIQTPAAAFYSKNYNAFIGYSYGQKIYAHTRWRTHVFAGGQLNALLNLRDHYYSNYTHYNTGEFIGNVSLSLSIIKRFKSPNDYISFHYTLALFAYDALNYLYNANVAKELNAEAMQNTTWHLTRGSRVVSINQYTEFHTELDYVKFLHKHWGVSLKHYFQYYREEKFKNLFAARYVNNQYLIGIVFKF